MPFQGFLNLVQASVSELRFWQGLLVKGIGCMWKIRNYEKLPYLVLYLEVKLTLTNRIW